MRMRFRRTMTLALIMLAALPSGCASRLEKATAGPDSTLAYGPRAGRGPAATITLCKSISKKSGKPLGAGTVFPLGEKAKVRALIDIRDAKSLGRPDLMLHLVWLDGMGNEIFKKRMDVPARDSMETIESVLSVPPDRRAPGRYSFRVYCYRELMAEKRFELVVAPPDTGEDEDRDRGRTAAVAAAPEKPGTEGASTPAAAATKPAKKEKSTIGVKSGAKKKKAGGTAASKDATKKKGKGKKSKKAGVTQTVPDAALAPRDTTGDDATTPPEARPGAEPGPAGDPAPAESSATAGGG